MSTTNITPPIQGLVKWMAGVMEESLQQVEAEIWDLEQKSEEAKGKAQPHYGERLKELQHAQKALKGELTVLGMERSLKLQHLQYHLCISVSAISVEPNTPRVSRSPSSQGGP